MRGLLVAVMLSAVMFSGCLDLGEEDTAPEYKNVYNTAVYGHAGHAVDDADADANSTDFDPEIVFTADKTSSNQTFDVLFEFNVTGMADAPFEAEFFSWTLAMEDETLVEGTADGLPANHTETFDTPGSFNVTFTFTDTDDVELELNETVLITYIEDVVEEIEEIEEEVEEEVSLDPVAITSILTTTHGCELCIDATPQDRNGGPGALGCIGFLIGVNEEDCAWVEIPETAWGLPYTVDAVITGPIIGDGTADVDIEFFTSCSPTGTSLGIQVTDGGGEAGEVPEGAGCLITFEFHWPHLGSEVTIVHHEAPIVETGGEVAFTPWSAEGVADAICPGCLAVDHNTCVSFLIGVSGGDCVFFELPDGAAGRSATFDSDSGFVSWFFTDSCSPGSSSLGSAVDAEPPVSASVPAGATCVVMFDYLIPGTLYSIAIS